MAEMNRFPTILWAVAILLLIGGAALLIIGRSGGFIVMLGGCITLIGVEFGKLEKRVRELEKKLGAG